MSFEDDSIQLKAYLNSLQLDLNAVLGFVLTELRLRESGEMRKDIITQSKSLRMGLHIERPPKPDNAK